VQIGEECSKFTFGKVQPLQKHSGILTFPDGQIAFFAPEMSDRFETMVIQDSSTRGYTHKNTPFVVHVWNPATWTVREFPVDERQPIEFDLSTRAVLLGKDLLSYLPRVGLYLRPAAPPPTVDGVPVFFNGKTIYTVAPDPSSMATSLDIPKTAACASMFPNAKTIAIMYETHVSIHKLHFPDGRPQIGEVVFKNDLARPVDDVSFETYLANENAKKPGIVALHKDLVAYYDPRLCQKCNHRVSTEEKKLIEEQNAPKTVCVCTVEAWWPETGDERRYPLSIVDRKVREPVFDHANRRVVLHNFRALHWDPSFGLSSEIKSKQAAREKKERSSVVCETDKSTVNLTLLKRKEAPVGPSRAYKTART
jgi:hypothetical protein